LDANQSLSSLTFEDLLELRFAWRTQVELVFKFKEYSDYAQTKGVTRMAEELFSALC